MLSIIFILGYNISKSGGFMKKLNLVVLISGNGSNLQAIIDRIKAGKLSASILAVISNTADAYGLIRAKNAGIETKVFSLQEFIQRCQAISSSNKNKARLQYNKELAKMIDQYQPDLIVLAGWMLMLSGEFVKHFHGQIINLHPALLPKYGGPGMYGDNVHRAVLANHETESGATVHFVPDEGVDTGPIILQQKVQIEKGETIESLAEKIHKIEHQILPEAIELIQNSKISA